ncbi:class I SAM-dependent methyltransferase [Candidatus Lokiarchaeum ossiferum]|uniref:class I SAM-dependent methyltransferase n=1 Tax=Candidatus Lokiarchaeum ossiferum TaxID=2951803 RepID=UPI00352F1289
MKNPTEIENYAHDQYGNDTNLQTRINIWDYGLNKTPISKWIFSNIKFPLKGKILELGSGTGKLWLENLSNLPQVDSIILSDFSGGMLDVLKQNLRNKSDLFSFQQINAQSIPFPDETFDNILAFHMLYHVPDLDGAIDEIYRTLKPNGKLYATTIYEDHLNDLYKILTEFNLKVDRFSKNFSDFLMRSGLFKLKSKFDSVKIENYSNKVIITEDNLDSLMAYIRSTMSPEYYPQYPLFEPKIKQEIVDIIDNRGKFTFTGKSGMLIATK